MGLSNEERISRLYHGADALHGRLANLDPTKVPFPLEGLLGRLTRAVDGIWFALLGKIRNNGYWLFGGDALEDIKEPSGAFSAAVLHHCERTRNSERSLDRDPLNDLLSIGSLLGTADISHKIVYEMFQISESMAYGLRRYDDDFRASFKDLDKLIADLQGACHSIFRSDDVYAKAYVLHGTLDRLYGSDREDPLRMFLVKECVHHNLSRPMIDCTLKEILAFDEWSLKAKPTPENRILLTLRIAGRRFHFKHQFRDMMNHLDAAIPQNRRKALEAEFEKCVKTHEALERESAEVYRANQDLLTRTAIHGHEAANWKS